MTKLIDPIRNFSNAPIKSISYGCTAQGYLFFVRYRRNEQIRCMGSLEFYMLNMAAHKETAGFKKINEVPQLLKLLRKLYWLTCRTK